MKIIKIDIEKGNVIFTLENQQRIVTDIQYGLAAMLKAYNRIELKDFLDFDIDVTQLQPQTPIAPVQLNTVEKEVKEMENNEAPKPLDQSTPKTPKKLNPWFEHLQKVRKENPTLGRNDVFALAKSTYKK